MDTLDTGAPRPGTDADRYSHGTGLAVLWLALFTGPVAWAYDLTAGFVAAGSACGSQTRFWLHANTAGAALVVIVALLVAWRVHREVAHPEEGRAGSDRARFLAMAAVALNAGFLVVIAAMAIPRWLLHPCD